MGLKKIFRKAKRVSDQTRADSQGISLKTLRKKNNSKGQLIERDD